LNQSCCQPEQQERKGRKGNIVHSGRSLYLNAG
jgi:hypothetical protein